MAKHRMDENKGQVTVKELTLLMIEDLVAEVEQAEQEFGSEQEYWLQFTRDPSTV
jgi:hypothetical protein